MIDIELTCPKCKTQRQYAHGIPSLCPSCGCEYGDTPPDDIARPAHYVEGRTIEPRDAIIDWCLSWYLGNVVKYVARAGRKSDALRDLRKAQQYLAWEIERLVAEREGNQ